MLTRKEEDYLEVILDINQQKGYVRIIDISRKLEIKPPSVVEMVKKLIRKGYLKQERHGPVILSQNGLEVAKVVKHKHTTFRKFFQVIGVPENIAKKDALKLEHNLHPTTILKLKEFVREYECKLTH